MHKYAETLWDFEIHMHHLIVAIRPDIVRVNKTKKKKKTKKTKRKENLSNSELYCLGGQQSENQGKQKRDTH